MAKLILNSDTAAGQLEELKRELSHCEIVVEAVPEAKPETFESGKWKYRLSEEGGAVLEGYTEKPRGKLQIPAELDGHAVTGIGDRAFISSDLKSITRT